MINNFFLDEVKKQFITDGNNLYNINYNFIINEINDVNSDKIVNKNIKSIEKGKFYFMMYDLEGKSNRMEQFNPLFVIDWFDVKGTRMLYAVSINFIPVTIRSIFFNNIFNNNLNILTKNELLGVDSQYALKSINFNNIYKLLKQIGFEWAIREFDMKLINNVSEISTNILRQFITMSTAQLTGVDDLKLLDIWKKKLLTQDQRERKMIEDLIGDFSNIEKELNKTRLTLTEKSNNIEKTLNIIKTIF